MINKIKLILLAIAFALITSAAFALYYYYNKSIDLEKDLKASGDLVASLNLKIIAKDKQIEQIKIDVKNQNEQLMVLKQKANAYKNEIEVINKKLDGDRLVKIANKKRSLLQKTINKANQKEIEEIKNLTKN